MADLLLATTNPGKAAELKTLLLQGLSSGVLHVFTPADFTVTEPVVDESGMTFAENARLKAMAFAQAYGMAAFADDSGLCVDTLNGEPGIHSARWTGPTDVDRNRALLQRLQGVPDDRRAASFVCAVCVAIPDGRVAVAEGAWRGRIAEQPLGSSGFGYDPLFLVQDLNKTIAELTVAEKNVLSHRAIAVSQLLPEVARLLGTLSGESK